MNIHTWKERVSCNILCHDIVGLHHTMILDRKLKISTNQKINQTFKNIFKCLKEIYQWIEDVPELVLSEIDHNHNHMVCHDIIQLVEAIWGLDSVSDDIIKSLEEIKVFYQEISKCESSNELDHVVQEILDTASAECERIMLKKSS